MCGMWVVFSDVPAGAGLTRIGGTVDSKRTNESIHTNKSTRYHYLQKKRSQEF